MFLTILFQLFFQNHLIASFVETQCILLSGLIACGSDQADPGEKEQQCNYPHYYKGSKVSITLNYVYSGVD